jgi:histidinol-phosphate aminotransferase
MGGTLVGAGLVRAHLGECPLKPPERVIEAARRAAGSLNTYPDPGLVREVGELYASYSKVDPGMVKAIPGSDTALELTSQALKPRRALGVHPGFYYFTGLLEVNAEEAVFEPIEPERDPALDPAVLGSALRRVDLAVVEDPNNPLGVRVLPPPGVLRGLINGWDGVLVIDEAYYEYSGYTYKDLLLEGSNVVLVRTLSKAFALAGARVGFILAPPSLMAKLRDADVNPFRIPTPSLYAARAALEDPSYARECVEYTAKWRNWVAAKAGSLGFKVWVGKAPFIVVETGIPGAAEAMEELGVKVASLDWWREGAIRISPSTPEGNEAIVEALEALASLGEQSKNK